MRLLSEKTLAAGIIILLLIVIALAIAAAVIPDAGRFVSDIVGTVDIHPSFIIIGAGLLIAGLSSLILALFILRSRGSQSSSMTGVPFPDRRAISDTESTTQSGDGHTAMTPEMQFALDAAFEKLKKSRDDIENQIAERTRELRDSLAASSDIVAAIPSALFIYEFKPPETFTLLTANPEARQLIATDIGDISGKDFKEIWPELHNKELLKNMTAVMADGQTFATENQAFNDTGIAAAYRLSAFRMLNNRLGLTIEDISERKRAELALTRERDRARMYLDLAGTLLIALDRTGIVTMINKAGCRVVGFEHDEIVGRNWFDVCVGTDRRDKVTHSFKKVIAGKTEPSNVFEHPIVTRDGQERVIQWNNVCLTDALGQITGLLCAGEDITLKRETEISLADSEQRLQTILDALQSGILIVDPTTETMIDANPVAVEMIHADRAAIIGRAYADYFIESEEASPGGENTPRRDTLMLRASDGTSVPIIRTASMITLSGKSYRLETLTDIAERVAIENALIQSEEEYRRLFENANEAIFIAQDRSIPFCNQRLVEITERDRDELKSIPFTDLIHPADRDRVLANHLRRLAGEELPPSYDFRVITKKQDVKWVEISAVLVEWCGRPATLNFISDVTERKRAEEALRESESKYRLLTENLKDVVIKISPAGNLEYVSPAIKEFGGYVPEEEIGQHIAKYFAVKTELNRALRLIQEVISNKVGASFEFLYKPKNGDPFVVEVTGKPVQSGNRTDSILIVLRDISFRKEAEKQLRRNMAAMDTASDGIAILDGSGNYTYLNLSHARIYGFASPEELIGKSWQILYSPQELERFNSDIMPQLRRDGHWRGEAVGRKKNGDEYPQEVSLTLIDDDTLICVVRDITERKTTEEALRASELRFRTVIESVPNIAIQGYNEEKRVIFWNQASEMLYGYSRQEALDRKIDELILPDEQAINSIRQNQSRTPLSPGEIGMRHKNGTMIPVYSSHVTMKNIQGDPEIYCFDVDLTALKNAQEKQVILQEKLERAQRMESLGILAGGVAHDLNNMLGPMVGYSDLLLLKIGPDSPYRKQIKRIGRAAQDAADVIQDLLTLARRGRYEIIPTDLNTVITDYLDSPSLTKLTEERQNVKIEMRLSEDLPPILGSSPHLSKTIMNLIVNSFDAMPDGGTLEISTEVRTLDRLLGGFKRIEPGEYILMKIKDSGSGIAAEDMDKIFEPYYSKKKMGASGSGLGLAVVYGIVKDHKGYYDVFSEPGRGTEFVLYFPVTNREITTVFQSEEDLGGTETALVIDDNEDQRVIASDILKSLGYTVFTASSGTEAVEFLSANEVDVIIIDMIMEQHYDGLDAYRDIIKIRPGQRAIIISGFSATDRVGEMKKLGAGEYVKKPFTLVSLGRAIKNELQKKVQIVT